MTAPYKLANPGAPRIVLIDEDSAFFRRLADAAAKKEIYLDYYFSLNEMGAQVRDCEFNVVLIDCDALNLSETEFMDYLRVYFGKMPIIVDTGVSTKEPGRGLKAIKLNLSKNETPEELLKRALEIFASEKPDPVLNTADAPKHKFEFAAKEASRT